MQCVHLRRRMRVLSERTALALSTSVASTHAASTMLSDPRFTMEASFPALAVDAAGSVTAVWQQYNGWRTLIMASRLP
ncbi:hypothetical protein GALL_219530 [mine drainage metagenome]|uniref:Uncharacterized protein n=1 Tax=mine drainage metagenome TaxID=410659 RepID=A0A1J5S2S4_9ZZZZ